MKKMCFILGMFLMVSCEKTEIATPVKKGIKSLNLAKLDSIVKSYQHPKKK